MSVDFYSIQEKLKFGDIPFLKTYTYAAVALIIDEKGNILIERRSDELDDPWSGQFAFPGGHFDEKDKDLFDTVIREVKEETGLELQRDRILGYFGPFSPRNKLDLFVYVFIYIANNDEREKKLVQSMETNFLGWIPLREIIEGKMETGDDIYFKINNGIIWGMSARVLNTFLKMIESL